MFEQLVLSLVRPPGAEPPLPLLPKVAAIFFFVANRRLANLTFAVHTLPAFVRQEVCKGGGCKNTAVQCKLSQNL
jgi:hypothetical protein